MKPQTLVPEQSLHHIEEACYKILAARRLEDAIGENSIFYYPSPNFIEKALLPLYIPVFEREVPKHSWILVVFNMWRVPEIMVIDPAGEFGAAKNPHRRVHQPPVTRMLETVFRTVRRVSNLMSPRIQFQRPNISETTWVYRPFERNAQKRGNASYCWLIGALALYFHHSLSDREIYHYSQDLKQRYLSKQVSRIVDDEQTFNRTFLTTGNCDHDSLEQFVEDVTWYCRFRLMMTFVKFWRRLQQTRDTRYIVPDPATTRGAPV